MDGWNSLFIISGEFDRLSWSRGHKLPDISSALNAFNGQTATGCDAAPAADAGWWSRLQVIQAEPIRVPAGFPSLSLSFFLDLEEE